MTEDVRRWITTLSLAGLAVAALLAVLGPLPVEAETNQVHDVVRTQQLDIVDAAGTVRASLSIQGLIVNDESGRSNVFVTGAAGGGVTIIDESGTPKAGMAPMGFAVFGADGRPKATFP